MINSKHMATQKNTSEDTTRRKTTENKHPVQYDKQIEVCAGATILDEEGRILLAKSQKWKDKYTVPGGHVEYGESLETALRREITEEMGIDVEVVAWLPPGELITKDRHYVFAEAVCRYTGPKEAITPCPREFTGDIQWMTAEDALAQEEMLAGDIASMLRRYVQWKESAEALDGWRRCLADFDNYKKRTAESARERGDQVRRDVIAQLLPVLDNFRASLEHVPAEHADSPWVMGLNYINKQLCDILAEQGLEEMSVSVGDVFDVTKHEAVTDNTNDAEETSDAAKEDNETPTIAKVVAGGYTMNGAVIRPARVVVRSKN